MKPMPDAMRNPEAEFKTDAPGTRTLLLHVDSSTTSLPGCADGVFFECAPDSAEAVRSAGALGLRQLLGQPDEIKARAAALAQRLLESEPRLRGQRQLTIFAELVIRELQHLFEVRHLYEVLLTRGFTHCRFLRPARHAETLQRLAQCLGSNLRVTAPPAPPEGHLRSLRRSWQRLRAGNFSRQALGMELQQVLGRLDPWQRRLRRRGSPTQTKGGLWFHSTAFTYTRIGLLYEPWLPQALHFLVDNPWTGGLALKAMGRPFLAPGRFGTHYMEPSDTELDEARAALRTHLRAVDLAPGDAVLRDLYLDSEAYANFERRQLPQALFDTRLFERAVQELQPAALIVGNPGWEAPALLAARAAGIPTLLLQHGILGDFCQFVDPPADHYIVRGRFWADFLAPAARARARVLNPPEPARHTAPVVAATRSVLFLTTPYALWPQWDSSDLDAILRVLLQACRQEDALLVVRVHPLEAVGSYQQLVSRLLADAPGARVQFSQGDGLEELVAASSVAVTYASTAFLDCLRHQIPIVSFDWHDFSYKQQIRDKGVFHFAASLASLQELVTRGIRSELPAFDEDCSPFLAPTDPAQLRAELAALAGGRVAP